MHRDNQRGVRVNPGRPQGVSVTALVCALGAVCALAVLARWPRWIRGPDEAYVVVAEDAWAGRLSVANYDDETMADRTGGLTAGRNRNFLSPTPPSIAVLLLPLAWLPAESRPILWLLFNVAAFLAASVLLGSVVAWPMRRPWLAVTAAARCWRPIRWRKTNRAVRSTCSSCLRSRSCSWPPPLAARRAPRDLPFAQWRSCGEAPCG